MVAPLLQLLRVAMVLAAIVVVGCMPRRPTETGDPNDEGIVYDGGDTTTPELEEDEETPFCRLMRPVTTELKKSISRDVACVLTDYNETGYFGQSANAMESSFKNACFRGLTRYESEMEIHDKRLGGIRASITAQLEVGRDGRIDLTEFGLVPSIFQLHDVQGPIQASVTIGFRDPVVRSVRDLGYSLAHLGRNPATPTEVRESIRRCSTQLCGEETVYTSNIVSVLPEAFITLQRGTASKLRPLSTNAKVVIKHPSASSFSIHPVQRINIAAQTNRSREMMVGHDACGGTPPPPTSECQTISLRGISATLQGCGRVGGGNKAVECKLLLMSPNYDREIELYIRDGARSTTIIDDQGAVHTAAWGSIANVETSAVARMTLASDVPIKLSLQYEGVLAGVKELSRLTVRLRSQSYVELEFRDLKISPSATFSECVENR